MGVGSFVTLLVVAALTSQADRLADLSKARGAFEADYLSPGREDLRVVENLGTSNLGNPGREWFFPAGSAAFRVWIADYGDSGHLVYQTRHGKHTTTDWVLRLKKGGRPGKASGTLSKMLRARRFTVNSPISKGQRALLAKVRPFLGITEGRGPYQGEIFLWFVQPSGLASTGYFHCVPEPLIEDGATYSDMSEVLLNPPVLPEEARFMGVKREGLWHGPGKFKATYETEFKF